MEEHGLKMSRKITEYLGCNEHQDAEIHLQGETVSIVEIDRHTSAEDGDLDAEVTHRVPSGWENSKSLECCHLCDRKMNVKIKGKV